MKAVLLLLPLTLAAQTPQPPPKPGSITGVVVNTTSGAPVKDCTVTLQSKTPTHDRFRYIAITDAQGQFVFPKVEPDPAWRAEAQCAGFTMPPETRRTLQESAPIAVAEAQNVRDVSVKLVPLGTISGKITDPDGEPLRGVSVQALQSEYLPAGRHFNAAAASTTDARGRYRLYFLNPGRYVVRVFARVMPPGPAGTPGHIHNSIAAEGFLPAWYPAPAEPGQQSFVDIQPGGEMANLDFRLARTPVYDVLGKLVTDAAKPPTVNSAPCTTANLDRNYAFAADSKPDHSFTVRSLPPGQYCLSASQGNWRLVNADAVVPVSDHDVESVVLNAPAPTPLEGSVRVEDPAHPLPALRLFLQDTAAPACCDAFVEVKPDGTFITRPLPPGTYLFAFFTIPKGLYLKSMRLGERTIAANRLEVRPGLGNLSLVLGTDPGELAGSVQDADGKPGDHMFVTIAPSGDRAGRLDLLRTAETQPDGTFQFADLAPGDYQAYTWESRDDDLRSPDFLALFASQATAVTVDAAGKASVQLKPIPAKDIEDAKWRSR